MGWQRRRTTTLFLTSRGSSKKVWPIRSGGCSIDRRGGVWRLGPLRLKADWPDHRTRVRRQPQGSNNQSSSTTLSKRERAKKRQQRRGCHAAATSHIPINPASSNHFQAQRHAPTLHRRISSLALPKARPHPLQPPKRNPSFPASIASQPTYGFPRISTIARPLLVTSPHIALLPLLFRFRPLYHCHTTLRLAKLSS